MCYFFLSFCSFFPKVHSDLVQFRDTCFPTCCLIRLLCSSLKTAYVYSSVPASPDIMTVSQHKQCQQYQDPDTKAVTWSSISLFFTLVPLLLWHEKVLCEKSPLLWLHRVWWNIISSIQFNLTRAGFSQTDWKHLCAWAEPFMFWVIMKMCYCFFFSFSHNAVR